MALATLLRTRRFVWGFVLLVFTLVLTFSYASGRRYVASVESIEHTLKVENALNGMLEALVAEESGNRGYVITGDDDFLEQSQSAETDYENARRSLSSLVASSSNQRARLQELEPLVAEKRAFMLSARELRARGEVDEVLALVSSRRGKLLMDRIRSLVRETATEERRLLELHSRAAAKTQRDTLLAIGGGGVLTVLLLGAAFVSMRRSAERLWQSAEQLAASEERYRGLAERLGAQSDELRELSLKDGLTGLYNRRGLFELAEPRLHDAQRSDHGMLLLFADLDGLKRINDELGHELGDEAIREAARLLRTAAAPNDVVARLGGDEFVVLAADATGEAAARLRAALQAALDARAREGAAARYQLGFSLGAAAFDPRSPIGIDELLARADARMYEHKLERRAARQASRRTSLWA